MQKRRFRFESPYLFYFWIWSDNRLENTENTGLSISTLFHRHLPCDQLPYYQPRPFIKPFRTVFPVNLPGQTIRRCII